MLTWVVPRSSPLFSTATTSSASVLCSSDQLRDVVSLALELLPPLPEPAQIVEENRRIIAGTQPSWRPSLTPSSAVSCLGSPILFRYSCHVVGMALYSTSGRLKFLQIWEHSLKWRLAVQGKQGQVASSRMLWPQARS